MPVTLSLLEVLCADDGAGRAIFTDGVAVVEGRV